MPYHDVLILMCLWEPGAVHRKPRALPFGWYVVALTANTAFDVQPGDCSDLRLVTVRPAKVYASTGGRGDIVRLKPDLLGAFDNPVHRAMRQTNPNLGKHVQDVKSRDR